jgi:hypothetical protein
MTRTIPRGSPPRCGHISGPSSAPGEGSDESEVSSDEENSSDLSEEGSGGDDDDGDDRGDSDGDGDGGKGDGKSGVVELPELFRLKCLSSALEARPHLNGNNPSIPRI